MQSGSGIDPLNPERSHVSFLVTTIPVGILKGLFNTFSSNADAVFGSPPEPFCKLEYFLLVHLSPSTYVPTKKTRLLPFLQQFND